METRSCRDRKMNTLIRVLDALSDGVGKIISLVAIPILLIVFTTVVIRYLFGIAFVWLQDSYVWLTSLFFMGMVGSTLLHDKHVRVALFYGSASGRKRALVNALGVLILLWPTLIVIVLNCYRSISRSWQFLETSVNEGGLQFAYLHKSLIYLFCALLFLQGLSLLLKSVRTLIGHDDR